LQLAAIGWNKRSRQKAHSSRWRSHLPPAQQNSVTEEQMGLVMIRCPGTGRAIPTGMKADRERFRCSPVFFARTFCPICKTSHEWFAREAWVHEPDEKRHRLPAALALQPV
jgi:hypothetical protein